MARHDSCAITACSAAGHQLLPRVGFLIRLSATYTASRDCAEHCTAELKGEVGASLEPNARYLRQSHRVKVDPLLSHRIKALRVTTDDDINLVMPVRIDGVGRQAEAKVSKVRVRSRWKAYVSC